MATPKTLTILLLFLGVISACPDGKCRQLFFRADFTFGNKRLIKHVIESVNVRDFDNCELSCYHQPNCVSINFNVIRDSGGFHKCELNNATHRGHDNELENKDGYIYKGAESACDKGPCKNNGTCQSGYTDKGYRCLCPPQWTSHHCDEGIIPHPSAWFPLNATYKTSEIENRTTSGTKGNKVHLSLGPDGTQDGSYFFRGSEAITFSDNSSKLNIGVSITILCWLYTYNNGAETNFLQFNDMKLFVNQENQLMFPKSSSTSSSGQFVTGPLAGNGWAFVGVSYDETTAEAKLWIDGKKVNSETLSDKFHSRSSELLKLGGNSFEGKMTQLMLFNIALTQEQIQGIKGRMKLPAMIFESTIISKNSFYSAELASFLAPVVGQMESKWELCYNAIKYNWNLQQFHKNCDNKNHTVTIIKRMDYIFGGYTDIPWDSSNQYGETFKAFIFSLNNYEALPPFKCLAKHKSKAIWKGQAFGPSFGDGPHFSIEGRNVMAYIPTPYSAPIGVNKQIVMAGIPGYFSPENYEVFYLV